MADRSTPLLAPATGEVLARVAEGGPEDVGAAVAAARRSFERVARITRPARLLKDFRRVPLAPGDERSVQFEVTHAMLRYPLAPSLETAELVWDPGEIILHVGPNSRDTQQVSLQWEA